MLYKSSRHVPPRNNGRTDLVRRMSYNYEQTAQKQGENALDAASFEIMLYKIKTHGLKCTCCHDARQDILNPDGLMDETIMDAIIDQTLKSQPSDPFNTTKKPVVVSASPYNPDKIIDKVLDFDDINLNTAGEITSIEGDLDEPDPEDYELLEEFDIKEGKFDYMSALTSNCPVCSRTGFVGGFNLANGDRRVYDSQSFTDFAGCQVMFDKKPYQIDSMSDDYSVVRLTDTLPRSVWKVITFRAMNGWQENSDWQLYVVNANGSTSRIMSNLDLKAHCTGMPTQFELRFKGSITHLEFLFQSTNKPLFCDITTLNRTSTSKRINDLEAITFNLPTSVGTIRKGDVFFERDSRVLWVVSQVEIQRSALLKHGFTGSAERVKSMYEPYSLFNPYLMSNGEIV